jgi:hypothetical protein
MFLRITVLPARDTLPQIEPPVGGRMAAKIGAPSFKARSKAHEPGEYVRGL